MKIVFPELGKNSIADEAIKSFESIEFLPSANLETAVEMLERGLADSMISGLDYSSRDVLLAYKAHIPLKSKYFSSSFLCKNPSHDFVLADGGVNKLPTAEQLLCIVEDSTKTYLATHSDTPRIALLSYSTNGSGGKNPDLEKYHFVIDQISKSHPDWLIDGEMQLDTAISPTVAAKKFPSSKVAGHANVLIVPDLNSGNLLYKSLEQFAGFTIAGPIIQGFKMPLADLSRGSTVEDTILTIDTIRRLLS